MNLTMRKIALRVHADIEEPINVCMQNLCPCILAQFNPRTLQNLVERKILTSLRG